MLSPENLVYRHMLEVTANTTDAQGLTGIWNKITKVKLGTYSILEDAQNTFCQKYIVPSARLDKLVNSYTNTPSMSAGNGITITFGFRTPSTIDTGNTKIIYLWDLYGVGYQAYIFFRSNLKRVVLRYGSTDLVTQTDYDFQPDTDYHMLYRLEAGNFQVYVNGVLVVSGTNTTSNGMQESYTLQLFGTQRYSDPSQYPARFYYMYIYYTYVANYTQDQTEYINFLQEPGFKTTVTSLAKDLPNPIPIINTFNTYLYIDPKVFIYSFTGQVTFNNIVKYKHPSTTLVQLLDPISKVVLKSTMTNNDGTFQLQTDKYPKYSQLLAIDYSGEYNTQTLLLKIT